jgi:hypothetical protein
MPKLPDENSSTFTASIGVRLLGIAEFPFDARIWIRLAFETPTGV